MQVLNLMVLHTDIIVETQEQARTELNAVVTHMTNRGCLINPADTQGPHVKFLEIVKFLETNSKILRNNLGNSHL